MRKIFYTAVLTLALVGCAEYNAIFGTTVSPKDIIIAGNAFDAAEATATNYLTLPACVTGGTKVCRDPAVVTKIVPLIRAGRKERSDLEGYSTANGGAPAPVSLLDALDATVNSLQSLFSSYNISK